MRRWSPRVLLLLALAVQLSCGTSPSRTALEVVVTIAPSAKSACVIVEAGNQRTEPLPVAGKTELKVGVVKTEKMPASVPVVALGYSDAACLTRIVPIEQSDYQDAAFQNNAVVQVQLLLAPVTGPTDADGDGSAVPADCDDAEPTVHPGAPELCGNQVDDDCDFLLDCADDGCSGQACAAGATCGLGDCREAVCSDGLDNDGKHGTDCADPDCDQQTCANSGTCAVGTCQGATTEVGLCADDTDNDGDGAKDCADSDCAAATCSDGNLCTAGETCQSTSCAGGAAVTCAATAPMCFAAGTGVCQPTDGGCQYAPAPADAGCSDGNLCTVNDLCNGDGGCSGTQVQCSAPPGGCFLGTGTCQAGDGGCFYPPRDAGTGTCSDGNNCTVNDACDGDGGCAGTAVVCTPAACQAFSGTCTGGGACNFTATPGASCDGGKCNAQLSCVQPAVWPYTPSNFNPANVPTPSNAVVITCGTAAIRTTLGAPGYVFEGWCGGSVQPVAFQVSNPGGTAAIGFSMLGLTITGGDRLRVYGDRPVIFAVQGDVLIDGELEAGAVAFFSGAGGDADCPTGARPTPGVCDSNPICGGGGGAGYGGAGRDGGLGEAGSSSPGGAFGAAWGTFELVPLVGGCRGASGGAGQAFDRAAGGGAGGAVQVSATGTLTVNDRISSVGGGGQDPSSNTSRGGAGAGSGGAILLEANQFTLGGSGWLSCNGGGGGEGSDGNSNPTAGDDGDDNSTTAAAGGNSTNNGGAGGDGQTLTSAPTAGGNGSSGSEHGGGGGGGAGLGRVRINVATTCTLASSGAGRITAVASSNRPDAGCP